MYLKYLQIVNYKNLKSTKFEFEKGTNTIIGENDVGKTNAMTALRILLDDSYYYSPKQLKEDDFSDSLGEWRGHWIILSAFFDNITPEEKENEICQTLIPEHENALFLKNYISCKDNDYGVVTLYIRPQKKIRTELSKAKNATEFDEIRSEIKLSDYVFYYTARSQADFTNSDEYNRIVGDLDLGECSNPDDDDDSLLGVKFDVLDLWKYISVVYIDALRDVKSELHKPKNPINRIVDTIQSQIEDGDIEEVKKKIRELNATISGVKQVKDIGSNINGKLNEIIGMIYSPDIIIESQFKDDINSLSKHLTMLPENKNNIDALGLGHLNMIYIALKLVEFEIYRDSELLNIMIIEEPEAHIHTHIQKTLFENLSASKNYTQVIMTTHSTHLSEVSDICRVNVLKAVNNNSLVMQPTNELDLFGKEYLGIKGVNLSTCLQRYLDAKRSVLLFSKGVILVEGDGEEILIPNLVKKVLGISLDEIGIGLINVGNVAFENIACIFNENRIQRYCAIITDLDQVLEGAEKCSEGAAKLGKSRQQKLTNLFGSNAFVESFYTPYTLEVDFANEESNRTYIEKIIKKHYVDEKTIKKHINNLNGKDAERYDSVLTVAKGIGKGWYATLLSNYIGCNATIPENIINAVAFAGQEVIKDEIFVKMIKYSLPLFEDKNETKKLIDQTKLISTDFDRSKLINDYCNEFPEDMITKFIKASKNIGG